MKRQTQLTISTTRVKGAEPRPERGRLREITAEAPASWAAKATEKAVAALRPPKRQCRERRASKSHRLEEKKRVSAAKEPLPWRPTRFCLQQELLGRPT